MLVHACRKDIVRHSARAREGYSIPSNVQQKVTLPKFNAFEPFCLLIGNEGKSRTIKAPVENILAAHQCEARSLRQI
jgi:hypothetical protein